MCLGGFYFVEDCRDDFGRRQGLLGNRTLLDQGAFGDALDWNDAFWTNTQVSGRGRGWYTGEGLLVIRKTDPWEFPEEEIAA